MKYNIIIKYKIYKINQVLIFIYQHITLQIYQFLLVNEFIIFLFFVRKLWHSLTQCFESLALDVLFHYKRASFWTQETCSWIFFKFSEYLKCSYTYWNFKLFNLVKYIYFLVLVGGGGNNQTEIQISAINNG